MRHSVSSFLDPTQLSTEQSKSAGVTEQDFSFWQLRALLLESFWQIQAYLSTALSSLFRHGCSSCCGEFLSRDDIIINYLQVFFQYNSLRTPYILKRWKEVQGSLRVFDALFSHFILLEVEILSEMYCNPRRIPLSILVPIVENKVLFRNVEGKKSTWLVIELIFLSHRS